MRNFQQKRRLRDILQSKPVLAVLGLAMLFFAWGVIGLLRKMEVTVENKNIAENKVAGLEKQKETLSTDISSLQTASGVEATIREKFGLGKDGEGEVVVTDDTTPPAQAPADSGGFWGFIKNLFK